MKKLIALLTTFVVIFIALPFSVSSAEQITGFKADFFELDDLYPIIDESRAYYSGDVLVFNSADEIFEALGQEDIQHYGSPAISDYISALPEGFFNENSLIAVCMYTPNPDHNFTAATITREGDYFVITCDYWKTLGVQPDVLGAYTALIQIDSEALNGIKHFVVKRNDITEYPRIDNGSDAFYAFNAFISEQNLEQYREHSSYFVPVTLKSRSELEAISIICNSRELNGYIEGLTDEFFAEKALIVFYDEFDYTDLEFTLDKIIDDVEGTGEYWTIHINVDHKNRKNGKDSKLFVIEADASYADCEFWCTTKSKNIKGDVLLKGDITSSSYIMLKRFYFGTFYLDEEQQRLGDIDNNGVIDSTDCILLKRAYFGTYEIKYGK